MDIGFIGCGSQGGGMALRLLAKGHRVMVVDPNPAAIAEMKAAGGIPVATPREAADGSEITFSCVLYPEICREIALGKDGVIHGKRAKIHVEASTVGQSAIEKLSADLAPHGVTLVDAPVSGGHAGAIGGTLTTIVSGPAAAVAVLRPVLHDVAGNVFEVGEKPGVSQVYKIANNMMSLTALLHAGEVIAAAVKAGVDPDTLIDVLNVSSARNIATTKIFPERVLNRGFKVGGQMTVAIKDTHMFLELASELGLPAPISAVVHATWLAAGHRFGATSNTAAAVKLFEEYAGVEIRGKSYRKD